MARHSSPPKPILTVRDDLRRKLDSLEAHVRAQAIRHEHAHPREELTRATRHLAEWRREAKR